MDIVAFKNSTKWFNYLVEKNEVAFDLDGAGVTKIEVVDNGAVLSTETGEVSFNGSTLSIQWGKLALSPGEYSPTVWVYSPTSPDGEVLYGPVVNPITLTLVEDERPHNVKLSATPFAVTLSGPSKPIASIVVDGQIIDFANFAGDLAALSQYPLSTSDVPTTLIKPVFTLPTTKTYTFKLHTPERVYSYQRSWFS